MRVQEWGGAICALTPQELSQEFISQYGFAIGLVWFETCDDFSYAVVREKDIKKWRRAWKSRLIEQSNPQWVDLCDQISH